MASKNTQAKQPVSPSIPEHPIHKRSRKLESDARLRNAPKLFRPVHHGIDYSVIIRVYSLGDTRVGDLLTVSVLVPLLKKEYEFAFDERFPVSIRFRTHTDDERVDAACEQIKRSGGYDWLVQELRDYFKP